MFHWLFGKKITRLEAEVLALRIRLTAINLMRTAARRSGGFRLPDGTVLSAVDANKARKEVCERLELLERKLTFYRVIAGLPRLSFREKVS